MPRLRPELTGRRGDGTHAALGDVVPAVKVGWVVTTFWRITRHAHLCSPTYGMGQPLAAMEHHVQRLINVYDQMLMRDRAAP